MPHGKRSYETGPGAHERRFSTKPPKIGVRKTKSKLSMRDWYEAAIERQKKGRHPGTLAKDALLRFPKKP